MSVTMSVSVLSIVATGLDRYLAVVYPLGARNYRTVKKAVAVIGLTWIFSLAVMAPRVVLFDEISVWHITGMTTLCNRVHTHQILQLDTSLNFVFMYLLPLTVLCICHSRIGQRLWTSKRPGNPLARHGQMRMLLVQHKRRIAKMIFAVTAIFAIGWLPIHVYHLVEDFDKGNILFGQIVDRGTIALFFSFGANALNPIIYCLFSSNFRKHFVKALRCWGPRRNTSVNGEDLGYFRSPVTVEIQLENPRPPPVLLPRPASLLTDSASYPVSDHIYIGKLTQLASANMLSLQPLLHEESKANSSCSESSPTCSSFSVTTMAQVEVNPFQMASGSSCRQEEDRKSPRNVASQSTINVNALHYGHSHNLERANSLTRRACNFTKSQRRRSYDSYSCDKEVLGAFNRLKDNFTSPDVSDHSQRHSSYDKPNSPGMTETPKKYDRRNSSEKTERYRNDKRISPKKPEFCHIHYSQEMIEVGSSQNRRNSLEITEVLHSPSKLYSLEVISVRQKPDKRDKMSSYERHQQQSPVTSQAMESKSLL
ncbi:unnamed protein product [Candidula unifasciata]|uniref:G-protein coupled receptors family 1 profile domain-containing protein n=1 Tax=Candidula unifasciata TaxID=100452 RepID=A0A8S3YW50_9EUPU|nr:unnamed protein product [Candidula unifasciata]